jgi:enoyl-[acyl-carrier protein] reductase II
MNLLCEVLSIKYPIIQGGMGNVSHPELAVAISEAGGLGTIGAGTMNPEEIEQMLLKIKEKTAKPYCLNIPITVQPYLEEVVALAFKHDVPVISLSAGNPLPYIKKFQEKGAKVICVVASVKQAKKADEGGADVIVAEGYEAAGINSNFEITTLTLIPQIVKEVKAPVVAAGGIGDGKGLLAMLALGASGVQMGTRFIATKEALVHEKYKKLIVEAGDVDTVIVGRSVGRVRRLLNTPYAQRLLELERQGITLEQFNEHTDEAHHIAGAIEGKLSEGHLNAGQIAGLIDDIPTVSELLERMIAEAKVVSAQLSDQLL